MTLFLISKQFVQLFNCLGKIITNLFIEPKINRHMTLNKQQAAITGGNTEENETCHLKFTT